MARAARKAVKYASSGSDSDSSVAPTTGKRRVASPPSDSEDDSFVSKKGTKTPRPPPDKNQRSTNTAAKSNGKKAPTGAKPTGADAAKRRLSGNFADGPSRRKSLATGSRIVSGAMQNGSPGTPRRPSRRSSGAFGTPRVGGVAALARVRGQEGANGSFLGLGGPASPGKVILSKEVMNSNYEEWMKIATDGKVNTTNTWEFALIDYFHDMSLLRNSETEGGINFQKASCTLDGCVKIWTSRVDSVAIETGKLLSGLAEEANNTGGYGEHDSDLENDNDDGSGGRAKRQRAPRAQGSTLVDFNDKIKVKQLDLEFTVDPLFKKTCADFDEGGAAGILMNHLGIDGDMRVVFDAGDATLVDEADEEEQSEGDDNITMIDISKLKDLFLPSLDVLDNKSICPSLSSFKFSTSDSAGSFDIAALKAAASSDGPIPGVAGGSDGGGDGEAGDRSGDFFDGPGQDFGGGDYGGGGDDFFGEAGGGDDDDDGDGDGGGGGLGGGHAALGQIEAFDATRMPNERDLVMAMVNENGQGAGGMFDYFDKGFMKNWAGPEHWKLRRTVKKADDSQTAPRQRKERQAFAIDFETPLPQTRKELFASGTASTLLPGAKKGRQRSTRSGGSVNHKMSDHTLPDDIHFNSQQLLRLFLKPKAVVNMRRRGPAQPVDGQEVDENYWAQQAAAAQADANGDDDDDDDGGANIPFATQFFNDEGDDVPDFEEEFDNPVGDPGPSGDAGGLGADGTTEEDDLIAATQGELKRARPEFVNYAKKAKRVDVKKLKENIWRELEDLTKDEPEDTPAPREPETDEDDVARPTKAFTRVLGGLRSMYPKDKMEEISTSFCFICLLHLANEKGLRIQGDLGKVVLEEEEGVGEGGGGDRVGGDGEEVAKFVGGLEELTIFKEKSESAGEHA